MVQTPLDDLSLQSVHKGQLQQPNDYHLIEGEFPSFFNCGLHHIAAPAVGGKASA